jgi:phage baseplate assembly protein W
MDTPYIDYPFAIDGRGRTETAGENDHIRDMIEQVLFTNPGERVNRPDFGCGLKRLLFMPNSQPLAAATQVLVKSALQKWLENEIQVEQVNVDAQDSQLIVQVTYSNRTDGQRRVDLFTAPA